MVVLGLSAYFCTTLVTVLKINEPTCLLNNAEKKNKSSIICYSIQCFTWMTLLSEELESTHILTYTEHITRDCIGFASFKFH